MTLTATQRDLFQEIASRWSLNAHPGQIPPKDRPWYCYLMRSGRGGGKTRAGSEWVLQRVRDGYRSIALVGKTAADVRDTMIELGDSSILKICRPEERPDYEPSKRRLTFPNGAVAVAFSGEDPDQLRGPQFDTAWVDELAAFKYPQETWDTLVMGLRIGKNPQVFVTTTPRPTPLIRNLVKAPDTIDIRFSTWDNRENLSPQFIAQIEAKYKGTRLGRQELEGEILDDNPLALWKRDLIENLRVREAPPRLVRIVVGVDPAVSGSEESDETGIVAAGVAADGAFYILADRSLRGSPNEWAHAVSKAYSDTRADRVIGEVNNGGDLVEVNLRTVDRQISYKAVHATRGKAIRAEPIAALYEQGKVHHVGTFPQLEDQMVEWVPGDRSPDRCFIAGTRVSTPDGQIPIERITKGMQVLTHRGYKPVIESGLSSPSSEIISITFSNGEVLTGTREHPIFTLQRGFIPMDALVCNDVVWNEKPSSTRGSGSLGIPSPRVHPGAGISTHLSESEMESASVPFIRRSGRMSSVQSLRDSWFTIKMVISQIMTSRIWNVSAVPIMPLNTADSVRSVGGNTSIRSDLLRQSGTDQRMGEYGIDSMEKAHGLGGVQRINRFVKNVGMNSMLSLREHNSALGDASTGMPRRRGEISRIAPVKSAGLLSKPRDPESREPAPVYVVRKCAAGVAPVYNLTVKDSHSYFANGILVHNCDALVWALTELAEKAPITGSRFPMAAGKRSW